MLVLEILLSSLLLPLLLLSVADLVVNAYATTTIHSA
jgi:hypothetical protein